MTGYISSTFPELLNIFKMSTAETKLFDLTEKLRNWETVEAEVRTLTMFRSEFLHPHHAQHPSEACLAKLLV